MAIFPKLKIEHLDMKYRGMTAEDVRSNFTKYSEYKAIVVEDFLNSMLRSK